METGARDQNLQMLRGVAAMLVVSLHAFYVLDDRGHSAFLSRALLLDTHFGSMGVDLFFVISGAVMAMAIDRDPRPRDFLLARYRRLMPTFWIAALITIGVSWAIEGLPSRTSLLNSITLLPILNSGLYDAPIPSVGWTLSYEVYFYFVVTAALTLPRAARNDVVAAILLGGAVAGEWLRPISVPMLNIACNPILIEFLFGFWAVRASRLPIVSRHGAWLAVLGFVSLTIHILYGSRFSTLPRTVLTAGTSAERVIAWGVPSALVVVGLIGRRVQRFSRRPLERLGDASYALYLVHPALFMVIPLSWRWWGPIGSNVLILVLVAVATMAGLLAHRFVETPLLRRLKPQAASETASARTVRPFSLTSANPPSTWMRAETVLGPE